MKSGFDQHSENLVKSAEKLLRELENFTDLKKFIAQDLDRPDAPRTEAAGRLSPNKEEPASSDGRVDIRVSEDGMKAIASFYPARGSGRMPDMDIVRSRLEEEGVVFGVDWELAEEAVLQCKTGRKHIADVPIAEGKAPKDEISASIEIHAQIIERKAEADRLAAQEEAVGKKPFPLILVKKGDVLAREAPAVPGEEGRTVLGESIPYGRVKRPEVQPGANTERAGDEVIASRNGRLIFSENGFSVREAFEISGDVDSSVGDVRFEGDVIVHGAIREGFAVNAGGSVYCEKDIELTQLVAGGDVVAEGGIFGKKKALAKAGGEVRARFIEHCVVEAGGPVFAEKAIFNSLIRTHASVVLGRKGAILGGKTSAKDGITAGQLGSDKGTKTETQVGIDPEIFRKILWLNNKTVEMKSKIEEIAATLADGAEHEGLASIKAQMEKQLVLVEKAHSELDAHIEKHVRAEITVFGYVFPGVVLEICQAPFTVTEVMKNVRFFMDPETKTVKTAPLQE